MSIPVSTGDNKANFTIIKTVIIFSIPDHFIIITSSSLGEGREGGSLAYLNKMSSKQIRVLND